MNGPQATRMNDLLRKEDAEGLTPAERDELAALDGLAASEADEREWHDEA